MPGNWSKKNVFTSNKLCYLMLMGELRQWLQLSTIKFIVMLENKSLKNRPVLALEKEIISKADIHTIERMSGIHHSGIGIIDSSVPTIPTTFGNLAVAGA